MKKVLSGLVFLIVFTLVSCGNPSNSGGSGGAPQPATVQGKWTFHTTSTQGQGPSLALFDFTGAPGSFSSAQSMICNLTPTVACISSLIGNGTVTAQGTVQANGTLKGQGSITKHQEVRILNLRKSLISVMRRLLPQIPLPPPTTCDGTRATYNLYKLHHEETS